MSLTNMLKSRPPFGAFLLMAALAWGAAVPGQVPSPLADSPERAALFSYDRSALLDVRETKVEKRGGATVKDVDFAPVPGEKRVKAFLVVPAGAGPFAGVLWVHWLGDKLSNRDQFLEEAVALAPRGAVSLLVDGMWAGPKWYESRDIDQDFEASVRQVIELRRALDLLAGEKGVDPARIGVVGHDYGGMYATFLAGFDGRARTYVLAAVTPSLMDWAFFSAQPRSRIDYIKKMAALDLMDALRRATGASFLFQFGKNDDYVSAAGASVYFAAAPGVKERKLYDAGHSLALPAVACDRADWLAQELGLSR